MLSKQEAAIATLSGLLAEKNNTHRLRTPHNKQTSHVGAGLFQSLFKGRGMEFVEAREYKTGDDVRLIDWRLSAKYHKTYTKIFHEEREHCVGFLVDLSSSMHFATRQAFKSVLASHIAALLAWAFQEESNRIGGIILTQKDLKSFKPSRYRRNLMHLLEAMCFGTRPAEAGANPPSFAQACTMLRYMCKNSNIVFVISDFSQLNEQIMATLGTIAKTNELVCIHVFDPTEQKAPPPNMYRVTDGKKVLVLNTQSAKSQATYQQFFEQRRQYLQTLQQKYHARYIPVSTEQDAIDVVIKALLEKDK